MRRFRIGVDIDGVIAEHVQPLIDRINSRTGTFLRRSDVSEWNPRLSDTDLVSELLIASQDPEYYLRMRVISGARSAVTQLREEGHHIVLLTARPSSAREATIRWLKRRAFPYDELTLVSDPDAKGHVTPTDILVDDRIETLLRYVTETEGTAVLLRQPWNVNFWAALPHSSKSQILMLSSMRELPRVVAALSRT